MFTLTNIPVLDAVIICATIFIILQLVTRIYNKYFKKDNDLLKGGDLGGIKNNSDNK